MIVQVATKPAPKTALESALIKAIEAVAPKAEPVAFNRNAETSNLRKGAKAETSGAQLVHTALQAFYKAKVVNTASDLDDLRCVYVSGALSSLLTISDDAALALLAYGVKRTKTQELALKTANKRWIASIVGFGWSALSGRGGANNATGNNGKTPKAIASDIVADVADKVASGEVRAPRQTTGETDKFSSGLKDVRLERPTTKLELRAVYSDLGNVVLRASKEYAKLAGSREMAFALTVKAALDALNAPEEAETAPAFDPASVAPVALIHALERDADAEAALPMITETSKEAHKAQPKAQPKSRKSRGK
jgi:hypothetical protein